MGADIVGPLPISNNSNRYLLVFTDHFTKYAEVFAIKKQDADTIATHFVKDIICCYGAPEQLLTDRGKNFIGEVMKRVTNKLAVEQLRTSAVHPQTNGLTERFNKTLIAIISMFVSAHQKDWDKLLPFALYAYNTATHPSTKETPFYLMYSRIPNPVENLFPETTLNQEMTLEERKKFIEDQFRETKREVEEFNNLVIQKRMRDAERVRIDSRFQIGDLVWLYNKTVKKGLVKKLSMPWHGPYRILKFVGPVTVLLRNSANKTIRQPVHVSRLKKYNSPQLPEEPPKIKPNKDSLDNEEIEFEDEIKQPITKEIYLKHKKYLAEEEEPIKLPNAVKDDHKIEEGQEYEVARILNHRVRKGKAQFLVRWKGYTPLHDSWVLKEDMGNCKTLLEDYYKRNLIEEKKEGIKDSENKVDSEAKVREKATGGEPKKFNCEECGFIAKTRNGLRSHMRVHKNK